jgi:putative membrane protein
MHTGKHYSLKEVLYWTRRDILALTIVATIPTFCYIVLGWKWLSIPWLPVALLGTAVAFVVGFKNNASYDRAWEGRRIWGSIINSSRAWAIMVRDYVSLRHDHSHTTELDLKAIHQTLYNRRFAWLTALRYQLREPRIWEAIYKKHNAEFKDRWFSVDEHNNKVEEALRPYLSVDEYVKVMGCHNKAAQILALQSAHLKELEKLGLIEDFRHMELEKILVDLINHQGGTERLKNFPYPRQYATLNLWFIKIFIILIPLGMIQEFEHFGGSLWVNIPFSALAGWIFTTLEKIGESSESPFEGSSNDVPITAMARTIEIDMKEMLGWEKIPEPIASKNNILT